MTPAVSVVMSVYNTEKYLEQSIESILNQSFIDFEFIIIEDCSTDSSLSILKNYAQKDSRIKLIQKSENKRMAGFIENLNIGLREARGKYIARMDADDLSHPTRFEKQVKFLDENPDIFMVGSAVNFIDENNQFIRKLESLENHREIIERMPKHISMYHPAIMFRNNEQTQYHEKMFYCEDYDLYLRLINQGKKFYNFTESLLDYRILNNSISRKDGSFMNMLFVEKAKWFYQQEKKYQKSDYDNFVPSEFIHIFDSQQKTEKQYLLFALKTATKFNYKKEFIALKEKYSQFYSKNVEIGILSILISLPNIVSKIYFKIMKNIELLRFNKNKTGGGITICKTTNYTLNFYCKIV